ncbi:hypothetical protein K1Y79_13995 [Chitinophaga sp. B61]|uniref:Uncharacterized protein n=1 Tax=Chitinophaga rhizophila TaxID=2866212 RepID=A0ABS7GDF1_9BACT|nr:hypothetical protein [Chitinophaga rhizophila]
MLTFATLYLLRLYYPRWKAELRIHSDRSKSNNYGRWATRQDVNWGF